MKFTLPAICAMCAALLVSPVLAEEAQETPADVKQNSKNAQQQMDDVGEEAMDSADETAGEMQQPSEDAQEQMDTVGEDALTEQDDKANAAR